MPLFIYCPKCEARFDVTDCGDASRFLCDECGTEVSVRFANLILMPGGIATEIKEMADGSRWLVCPKCGRNANISVLSPGNRFRCRRCSMLLQVPSPNSQKPIPPAQGIENVIKCPGCRTRYDTSRYTPGNRFRCRRCGMTLSVPKRTDWKKTGEWEIDVAKSVIRCNRCNQTYPLGSMKKGDVLVCRKCRKVFTGLVQEPPRIEHKEPDEEWEIDLEAGFITCPGCRYSYDLSNLPQDADFPCKHCDRVFRMPKELPKEAGTDSREKIACPKCGAEYDVSGYLRGTMFSCSNCEEVLFIGLSGGYSPSSEDAVRPVELSSHKLKERSFTPEPLAGSPAESDVAPAQPACDAPAAALPDASEPEAQAPAPLPEPQPAPALEPALPRVPAPEAHAAKEARPEPLKESAPKTEPKTEPLPMPRSEPAQPKPRPATGRVKKTEPQAAPKKVPVPFPPLPPDQVMARTRKAEPAGKSSAAAPEAAGKQEEKPRPADSKTVVRLIVRCTVCGARHDAGGMTEGDKITCKCGKKIKIKGVKKPAANPSRDPVEDALSKRGVKSDDVEILDKE